MTYRYRPQPYVVPSGVNRAEPRHKVAIAGAGPVGLALAIDLAQHGVPSVVLDDNNVVSIGSRAICWAKRTLEIFDRLGVGERMLAKGVTWKTGRQFHGDSEVYTFDLLPEDGHKYPAFINLQQYYVEEYLIDRARQLAALIDLRFNNEVIGHREFQDHILLEIRTPDGDYRLETEWFIACDGAGSPTRRRMELAFIGQAFAEQFLIADIEMEENPFGSAGIPERWFWFDPPFHSGKSALLHMQPDGIYRIDLQLLPDADAELEARPGRVGSRIKAIVGERDFRLDWVSVYRFRCARLERFVHGRVIFAGDSAHVVSPFGARGGNGGIQDADNLGWKLAAVLQGEASDTLIESYNEERVFGAEENILNSARATNFMTPKSPVEALFREESLRLAKEHDFARKILNSGRLSLPCSLAGMRLQTPGEGKLFPGMAALDAPLHDGAGGRHWLIEKIQGMFTLAGFGNAALPDIAGIRRVGIDQEGDYPCFGSSGPETGQRYGADCAYLFRPDGHVCAVFDTPQADLVVAARERALGFGPDRQGSGA